MQNSLFTEISGTNTGAGKSERKTKPFFILFRACEHSNLDRKADPNEARPEKGLSGCTDRMLLRSVEYDHNGVLIVWFRGQAGEGGSPEPRGEECEKKEK